MLQGLANVGNTCSINTLIQCLGHCPAFLELILKTDHAYKKKDNATYSMYEELKLILKQMWIEHHSLVPIRFLKAFYESIGNLYQPGEQFDFTEMWMLLISNFLEELNNTNYQSSFIEPIKHQQPILQFLQEKAVQTWKLHTKDINSHFTDILHGIQIQQIQCSKCNKLYHNLELFSSTCLEIKHDSLHKCIEHFLEKEIITDWTCDHCKNKNAEKVVRFWKLPKIWMIILKRFEQTKKPINILSEFSCTELASEKIINYKLTAIANHFGSVHGGHYTATCLNPDNKWVEYDDVSVKQTQPELANNTNAYALFYSRF
jgi:ubiquitin C-terminal hydrolase